MRLTPRRGSRARTPAAGVPPLDLDDIQGNILRPYGHPATTYLFLAVVDAALARLWLGELHDQITSARHRPPPAVTLNLAVTYAGLVKLGVSWIKLTRLPRAFRDGMAARAGQLGDPMTERDGEIVPDGWHKPFGPDHSLHLMLMVSGDKESVAAKVEELEQGFWQSGVTASERALQTGQSGDGAARQPAVERAEEPLMAARVDGDTEHFGYRDGLSQPAIEGIHDQAVTGTGRLREGKWVPIKAGEFILGMPAEDGAVVDDVPSLTRNGSYLVLRKLEQDVAAFRAMVERAAQHTDLDRELVRAKLMGRWPDGTPLSRRAEEPDPDRGRDRSARNDFDFGTDSLGARCPIGSHIRRANPRGSMGFDGALEHRRRMIRRGMPYGTSFREGTEGDARGLVFVCYQADIADQFEFVQSQWMSDGNAFALGADRDPVVGEPCGSSGRMRFEGGSDPEGSPVRAPVYIDTGVRCVVVRGGEYFLVPSLSAIRGLSRLPDPADMPRPRGAGSAEPDPPGGLGG